MLFSMKMQVAREVDKHTDKSIPLCLKDGADLQAKKYENPATTVTTSIGLPAPKEGGHESKLEAPSISRPSKPIFYKSCIN